MLWPVKFILKWVVRLQAVAILVLAGVATALYLQLRQLQRTWGVDTEDAEKALAGDELIKDADIVETRTLVIDAAPSKVWPWLVQMGYGRAGWYSYDKLDVEASSADSIIEGLQTLAEGDVMPAFPGGGFVAKIVQPEEALVLYLDSDLVKAQAEAGVSEHGPDPLAALDADAPLGLDFASAMGDRTMPDFKGTWAFILEPEGEGRTRLIERFRISTEEAGLAQKVGMPMMGLGVFAMTRKHMLGVKERAEKERPKGSAEGDRVVATAA